MEPLQLPPLGLGTWMLTGATCTESVLNGIEIGYRFIDTAQMYGNEEKVGVALAKTSVPREELIIATKLGIMNLFPKKVPKSLKESLRKLQTDYVDILYIHWPMKITYNPRKTLGAMNNLVEEGLVKHIGVSNFSIALLKEAIEISTNPILANQVEMHPMLRLQKLGKFNKENNVNTIAYSPLGRGKIWDNAILKEIAQKNNISVPQVCLAYLMHRGAIPIPKASTKEHLQANWESLEVHLDAQDISNIESLPERRLLNPPMAPKWDKDD